MKKYFKKHKYLLPSASLFVAILLMIGFGANSVGSFFVNLGKVSLEAAGIGFGFYILQMFSGWVFWFWAPKSEDFTSAEERDSYFEFDEKADSLLLLYIYVIIAAVVTFIRY